MALARITGQDRLAKVWEGLQAATALGFQPIKINCVVLQGVNDDEVLDFARLSLKYPWHIRFLEFMPIGYRVDNWQKYYLPMDRIQAQINTLGPLQRQPAMANAGPATRYRLPDAPGEIGFISPVSNHFCETCNRLRLTADGRLRPCLFRDDEIAVKGPLRSGASDATLKALFRQAVLFKPAHHNLLESPTTPCRRTMTTIGG